MRTVSDCLNQLLDDGVLDEVLGRIMSGKEAEVFAAIHRTQPVAVKIFKPRHQRNFKNNVQYLEGRSQVRDSRTRRAMDKGSRFGRAQSEADWKETEHDALHLAFNAGVRVPRPIFMYEEALLMELVVDDEGMPAPRMSDLQFTREEAVHLHQDLFAHVRTLLGCHRIHGDLSAFNVLMAAEGATIIDFPQVVDAAANPQAEQFLIRDWKNVVEHLGRFAPSLNAYAFAGKALYRHYKNGTLERASATELVENYHPQRKRTERTNNRPQASAAQAADGAGNANANRGRQNRFTRQRRFDGGRPPVPVTQVGRPEAAAARQVVQQTNGSSHGAAAPNATPGTGAPGTRRRRRRGRSKGPAQGQTRTE